MKLHRYNDGAGRLVAKGYFALGFLILELEAELAPLLDQQGNKLADCRKSLHHHKRWVHILEDSLPKCK